MRKLKERDRGKQTLDAGVYPVVRFSHKGTPTSMLLKHSLRVLLLGHQVSSVNTITITLAPGSTKELLHKGWGSPRPPHKSCRRRSTPSRRVDDVPVSHQYSKVPAHRNLLLVHSRTRAQRHKALLVHSLRAHLALTLSNVYSGLKI